MYPESEAIAIAKRENNAKRAYLVVNKLQGKHIPVSPLRAFGMFDLLADKVGAAYTDERMLLVGFAETATAIGARLAVKLDSHYIQTTRETYGDVSWLLFSETHSHAVEQKLIRDDIDAIIGRTDRIVFVEDEVTTGNTILNIIKILEEAYPGRVRFAVASLLNGMPPEAEAFYHAKGIGLLYLQKTDHSGYTAIAESYCADGAYFPADTAGCDPAESYCIEGCMDARRCVPGAAYGRACEAMWERICLKNQWPSVYPASRERRAGTYVADTFRRRGKYSGYRDGGVYVSRPVCGGMFRALRPYGKMPCDNQKPHCRKPQTGLSAA